jgi:hypothetical protein
MEDAIGLAGGDALIVVSSTSAAMAFKLEGRPSIAGHTRENIIISNIFA